MLKVAMWIVLGILGFIVAFTGGFFFGGPYGAMLGMVAGILMFMPIIQMVGIGKFKGFLPLFCDLKDHEKFIMFPDKFGRLKTMIVNTRHEGLCHKKGLGIIDDKGTEYAVGDDPISFGEPKLGVTVDVKASTYTEMLEKNRDVHDYDEAIKKALGETKYIEFCKKYRKDPKPDIVDINDELQHLVDSKQVDEMEESIFGETWSFKNFCRFLKYNYHPLAMDVAVNREKLWVMQEQMGYKDANKAMGWARATLLILFGVMIFVVVISTVDLSSFGNLFGGI